MTACLFFLLLFSESFSFLFLVRTFIDYKIIDFAPNYYY